LHHCPNFKRFNFETSREQAEGNKWWFHLFGATLEIVSDPSGTVPTSVLKLFQQFMESSTIGQFGVRIRLLENLHRHLQVLESYRLITLDQRIQSYIWNTICYYRQYEPQVMSKLNEMKAPIEKKMKDFVKISRWNDANFYALSDSVKKSQRMLNKLLSEYKQVLKTSVSTVLVADIGTESIKKEKNKLSKLKLSPYYLPLNSLDEFKLDEAVISSISSKIERQKRFKKLPKIFSKAREVCGCTIEKTAEISRDKVSELDELTGTIIDKVHELQNLPVPEKGNQRKKALHNVHNLRRKNLADLFKTLQSFNLSHKRGIIRIENYEKDSRIPYDFLMLPMDLAAGWNYFLEDKRSKFTGVDKDLSSAWKGCEEYFQKSIGRISVLMKAFQSPSKELGPVIIERCRGFSADLFAVVCDQKSFIGKLSRLLWELKIILDFDDSDSDFTIKMNAIGRKLANKATSLEYELIQYQLVFESLTDVSSDWKIRLIQTLDSILLKIQSVKLNLNKLSSVALVPFKIPHPLTLQSINDSLEMMKEIASSLGHIVSSLEANSLLHTKFSVIKEDVLNFLRNCCIDMSDCGLEEDSQQSEIFTGKFKNAANSVLENVLLTFQKIEKLDLDASQELSSIQESTAMDILNCFDLETVVHGGFKLRSALCKAANPTSYEKMRTVLLQLTPILQQYALCAQFYLKSVVEYHRETCKLLSVLSAVFGTLAQKVT
jgi:midasin (ATPase involved in ribosome maturation)